VVQLLSHPVQVLEPLLVLLCLLLLEQAQRVVLVVRLTLPQARVLAQLLAAQLILMLVQVAVAQQVLVVQF
jgi:hypothetical protein